MTYDFLRLERWVNLGPWKKFDPTTRYIVGLSPESPVIAHVSTKFQKFIFDAGYVEENIPARRARVCTVMTNPRDSERLQKDIEFAKTGLALAHIFELLSRQPNGEHDGPLLTNGWPTCFPVLSGQSQTCVVLVRWYAVDTGGDKDYRNLGLPFPGWVVSALPFRSPEWGRAGHKVAYY